MKKLFALLGVSLLLASLLLACASTEPTQAPEVAEPVTAALRISGPATELNLSEADLKAMPQVSVEYTDKDGNTTTYTGVLITELLKSSGQTGTPDLALVAGDGYTYDLAAADYQNCTDCIVAFDPEGGLRSVLPALDSKAQVKDLVEIQIK